MLVAKFLLNTHTSMKFPKKKKLMTSYTINSADINS